MYAQRHSIVLPLFSVQKKIPCSCEGGEVNFFLKSCFISVGFGGNLVVFFFGKFCCCAYILYIYIYAGYNIRFAYVLYIDL